MRAAPLRGRSPPERSSGLLHASFPSYGAPAYSNVTRLATARRVSPLPTAPSSVRRGSLPAPFVPVIVRVYPISKTRLHPSRQPALAVRCASYPPSEGQLPPDLTSACALPFHIGSFARVSASAFVPDRYSVLLRASLPRRVPLASCQDFIDIRCSRASRWVRPYTARAAYRRRVPHAGDPRFITSGVVAIP